MSESTVNQYLLATDIIDWTNPNVRTLAAALGGDDGTTAIASRCFQWVRDQIRHSVDGRDEVVTVRASEVLRHGTGFCYAKSHLLAALLRANGIPAGFCYQRLSIDDVGPPFCLHGFNGVQLPEIGWYRVDARGNRPGVSAAFDPPREVLAFRPQLPGECTFTEIWPDPLPQVIEALRAARTVIDMLAQLPDRLLSDSSSCHS